jgi:CubicO group peptidase (beta-lactamase class C family)
MKRITGLALILFVIQLAAYGQTIEEKIKEIDAYANAVMTTHGGPGMAIAIVKDDKVVFAKGYGVKRLGGM